MKTVILLRHAKSDWGDPSLPDIDRELAPRGRENAPKMGAWINSQTAVDFAIVSPARRAQETFLHLSVKVPHEVANELYPTQAGNVLRLLKAQPNDQEHILIVAHNPGISRAVYTLLNAVNDDPKLEEMPTCACAILEFAANQWVDLDFGTGSLKSFMTPKRLKH